MKHTFSLMTIFLASTAIAEDTRQLDAHEHGVGALDIAIAGTTIVMEFHAPGADIIGFEYVPESAEDRAAVDAAVATLARPLDLFVVPAEAACVVEEANAELETEEDHDDHDDHSDHGHDDHDDHAEDDGHDDHDDHAEEASHTEFHAAYTLTCDNPTALTEINFAYFDMFENALEVEVQIITGAGAQAFEVAREAPTLDLQSLY